MLQDQETFYQSQILCVRKPVWITQIMYVQESDTGPKTCSRMKKLSVNQARTRWDVSQYSTLSSAHNKGDMNAGTAHRFHTPLRTFSPSARTVSFLPCASADCKCQERQRRSKTGYDHVMIHASSRKEQYNCKVELGASSNDMQVQLI